MPGYQVETSTHRIAALDYQVRALADRRQFSDPEGEAERAGVTPASWPMFGVVWPAGVALAEAMAVIAIAGRRILEVGCGLGLASLVLARRGADITASDHHPLAGEFLRHNTDLNHMAPIPFSLAPWGGPDPGIGRFDLVIGADVLYEHEHPKLLAGFLALHANPIVQFVMADAGRGHCGRFNTQMQAQGYTRVERRVQFGDGWPPGTGGRILTYDRAA
ncbi:MAG: SAM-dependent methyltransferase [Betaproteobacteria bacterium]|nr:SAM-dependent methyltransferase [Betaproteobacteria bacterium]